MKSPKALIEAGADVNLSQQWGETALNYAIWENQLELVQLLIDKAPR